MWYTKIGQTSIKIPPIIFGTSALGNLYQELDYHTKKDIIANSFESMPEYPVIFDTAGKYGAGLAIEELGKILKDLQIDPAQVIISNKLGWFRTPLTTQEPTFEKGVWKGINHDATQKLDAEGILACYEQGNALLGSDYNPRMLSVHDPDEYLANAINSNEREKRMQDILTAYQALFALKKKDPDIAIGIGVKDWKIIEELLPTVDFDWVMIANSYTIFHHTAELIAFINELGKRNITVINSAVFHSGFLVGSDYFDYQPLDHSEPKHVTKYKWRDRFFQVCTAFEVNPAHACIQFGMSHPAVKAIALNTSNPDRVSENINQALTHIREEFWEEMKRQNLIDKEYIYI